MKLINKIYLWSKSKIKENHLKHHKTDIKCPNCDEWYSVSGVEYNHKIETVEYGYSTICGQCGTKSYWNTEAAPVLILCDEDGIPLEKRK